MEAIRNRWLGPKPEVQGDLAQAARRDVNFLEWLCRHMAGANAGFLARVLYYGDGPGRPYRGCVKWVLTCKECRRLGRVDVEECGRCSFLVESDSP